MAARVIDGKAVAARVRADVGEGVAEFTTQHGRPPGLATVLVGEDAASAISWRPTRRARKSSSSSASSTPIRRSAGSSASCRFRRTSTASSSPASSIPARTSMG
jgi:5,10-methylene-tetrahydrofolate dehydrogenase/methenyl tetrahydrofolate cyclohydrolase